MGQLVFHGNTCEPRPGRRIMGLESRLPEVNKTLIGARRLGYGK